MAMPDIFGIKQRRIIRQLGKKALSEMAYPQMNNILYNAMNRTGRNYQAMLSDPTASSLLMAIVLWISRRWPEAALYLEKDGDPIYEHPMLDSINNANPHYGGGVLWFGTICSHILDGNAYWIKIRDGQLRIKEYWYVPHFLIEPKTNNESNGYIDYYEYKPGGKAVKINPEDIVHFRYGIDPNNTRKGMSPLKSVIRDAVTDDEADNFAASLLKNLGIPGLLVTPDPSIGSSPSDESVGDFKKYIKRNFSGDKRGEPMVSGGPWKIQQFGFDPRSMDLSAIRSIPEERVCAVTGVPAAVVGFGTGMNQTKVGATLKELREMAYEDAIIPLQRMIGPELKSQLLGDFEPKPDQFKIKFDLSEVRVLQEDQDRLHKRTIEDFNGGVLYLDEAREALGYEAGKSDRLRRIPFSTTELMEGQSVQDTQPPQEPIKMRKSRSSQSHAFIEYQRKAYSRLSESYATQIEGLLQTLSGEIAEAFNRVNEIGKIDLSPIVEQKAGIPPEYQAEINLAAARILQEYGKSLVDSIEWQAQYTTVAETTLDGINGVFGAGLNMPDPTMRAILYKGGKHIAFVKIDKQVHDAIMQAIYEARVNGMGATAVAREIRSMIEGKEMFPGIWQRTKDARIELGWSVEKAEASADRAVRQYRGELIARTETKYAQNVSSLQIARDSGTFNAMQITDGVYGAPRSGEVDIASNGQIVSFDGAEMVAEDEHPNGTLSLTPVIAEESEIEEPLLGR